MRQTNFLDTFTLHLTAVSPGDGSRALTWVLKGQKVWREKIIYGPKI